MLKHLLLTPTVLLILFSCDSNSLSSDIRGSESLLVLKWESNTNRAKIGIMDIKGNYLKTLFPTFLTGGRVDPSSAKISKDRNYLSIEGWLVGTKDFDPSWIANIDGSINYTFYNAVGMFWDSNWNRLYMRPHIQYYDMQERERRVIIIPPALPWANIPDVKFYCSVRDQSPYYGGEFIAVGTYEYKDSLENRVEINNLIIVNIYNYERRYVIKDIGSYVGSCKFSPTDSLIAFISSKNNQQDVYLIHMSGTGLQLAVGNIYGQSDIGWSPDGKKIAYSKMIPDKSPNVFFYDINRLEETQITFETEPNVGFILNQWLSITE